MGLEERTAVPHAMHIAMDLDQVIKPAVVAIGNFDGLHRGHQQVLAPILRASAGIKTVLTFYPHPQEVFSGKPRLLLTPPDEKFDQLAGWGIEQVVQLPFTREFASQLPAEFIETVLEQGLQVQQLSVGWDFCFGQNRSGNAQTLQAWGQQQGIQVDVIPELQAHNQRVSSSRIREALGAGEVQLARDLLGRRYRLRGPVVQGDQRGRQLGFPTANLAIPTAKFLPRDGVYSVWVQIGDHAHVQPGVMNQGIRPTITGSQRTHEVHLLDWQGDLYDQILTVELEQFIRSEQRFGSLDQLKAQIATDCQIARQQLAHRHGGADRTDPWISELKTACCI